MKTVVITGSTRGLGFEMAKLFRAEGWNLVINGVNAERMEAAAEKQRAIPGAGKVESFAGSVAEAEDIRGLIDHAVGQLRRHRHLDQQRGRQPAHARHLGAQ